MQSEYDKASRAYRAAWHKVRLVCPPDKGTVRAMRAGYMKPLRDRARAAVRDVARREYRARYESDTPEGAALRACDTIVIAHRKLNSEINLWQRCRARAFLAGVPFDLLLSDLAVPEFCPVLGVRLVWSTGGVGVTRMDNNPSVECLVPALGYVSGNVRIISLQANIMSVVARAVPPIR